MKTESVSTHDLREGDLVWFYGVVFRLRDRKNHGLTEGFDPDIQGDCITFRTDIVDATERCSHFPASWAAEWTFQGNKLSRFARVLEG
jgi:hypothetical protein